MKKSLLLMSLVLVLFSSCEVEVTGVSLSEASVTLEVGDTTMLTANILPERAEGTVVWTSSNPQVATVVDGRVIGVSVGTAQVTASVSGFVATCVVTVVKARVNFQASLNGTEYFPIILDGITAGKLGTRIRADFRPDEINKFLYIWDNTFTSGASVGPNAFGEVEPWTNLVVGTQGWSGAGFFCADPVALDRLVPVTANPDRYVLHMAIKSRSNAVFVFGLDGQSNVRFAVGPAAFNDNGVLIQPLADFPRDGEWQKIEIPMTTLRNNGLLYGTGMNNKNVLWLLAGGVAGTSLELDAVFIYRKP